MKKLAPLFLVLLLVAFAAPALAGDGDVQFYADKTITLDEEFFYFEEVAFSGYGFFLFDGEAWAKIQEQQELYFNELTEYSSIAATKRADITGSFSAGSGVVGVNQAPGNLNNQANEVAISVGSSGTPVAGIPELADHFLGMFAEAQIVSVQYNGILYDPATDTRAAAGNILNTDGFTRTTSIDSSFDGWDGVVGVNQAAGSLNNQGNAVAIAAGVDQIVVKAASNVMLAQNSAHNQMFEGTNFGFGNNTSDSISNGSFAGAHGVFNVNQASGSLNNQKNAVAISFSHPAVP